MFVSFGMLTSMKRSISVCHTCKSLRWVEMTKFFYSNWWWFGLFICQIKIRDSKYGHALVIQTLETGGGYTLGFRVDPAARLVDVYKELDSLFNVYSTNPIFGVTYERREVWKHIIFLHFFFFFQFSTIYCNNVSFISVHTGATRAKRRYNFNR